jgi:hypothetical protein
MGDATDTLNDALRKYLLGILSKYILEDEKIQQELS